MSYDRIVISSGHGLYVRGACGIMDEVDEARTLVDVLADELKLRGVDVVTYHDDISKTQNENLNRIVDFHNSCTTGSKQWRCYQRRRGFFLPWSMLGSVFPPPTGL